MTLRTPIVADFASAAHFLRSELVTAAAAVKTERWQGVAANTETFELRNASFEVPLGGVEDLQHWRDDIKPNLPWADDHFAERVGGEPLNPGEEWRRWPWASRADSFRSNEIGPQMPPQDWAYLAGMIDGEGTIYYQKHKMPNFQGVVRVYQKDRRVLDFLKSTFRVGDVNAVGGQDQVLNGKTYNDASHQWAVGAILEIRWILTGTLPYLRVKQDSAKLALMAIEACLKKTKENGAPFKKVWDRDWPARFNHTYMSRLWPKKLDGGSSMMGHHWHYGDLQDLVEMLAKEPHTRQAWIPLFFPEDTGFADGGRKPCTLGYQVMVRDGQAHIWYPLRSCDFVRHWRDDCYLAVRLLLWIIDQCRMIAPATWAPIVPGSYAMHMTSLHVFATDRDKL